MKFITRLYITGSEPVYYDLPRKIYIMSRDVPNIRPAYLYQISGWISNCFTGYLAWYPIGFSQISGQICGQISSKSAVNSTRYPANRFYVQPDILYPVKKDRLVLFLIQLSQNYFDFGDHKWSCWIFDLIYIGLAFPSSKLLKTSRTWAI